jgi:hypothetical protein
MQTKMLGPNIHVRSGKAETAVDAPLPSLKFRGAIRKLRAAGYGLPVLPAWS